jgi:glutamate-ammonia-ligase adenylyltransferase
MKLGRGGIREIEFFTQTRQLIAGGRDRELRMRGTREGLDALADKGWIEQDLARTLSDHYVAHRTVEHRLQMVRDAQTHNLPKSDSEFDRLAALMDMDRADLEVDLHRRLSEVHEATEGFFAPDAIVPVVSETLDPEISAVSRAITVGLAVERQLKGSFSGPHRGVGKTHLRFCIFELSISVRF